MNKMICILTFSLIITVSVFAQSNGLLHSKYSETSSTAQVKDKQLKYWLYNLPPHISFDDIVAELCEWLENGFPFKDGNNGWQIWWDGVKEHKPNTNLAPAVKTMMLRLKRDVSVTILYADGESYTGGLVREKMVGNLYVESPPQHMYINYYDSATDTYSTLYFHCYL
jgi:hypothetical protein